MEPSARKTQSGPLLCVANIHTFSNPKFPDVKLWQTHALVKQVGLSKSLGDVDAHARD